MIRRSATAIAKLLLVILALWMPISTFAAAKASAPASDIEAPCGETPAPVEADETQSEDHEPMHASSFNARHAPARALSLAPEGRSRRHGRRSQPPHRPPSPA